MKTLSFTISILAVVVAIGLFVNSTEPNINNLENDAQDINLPHSTYLPEIPSEMTFADEKVPLERTDVYESLDREMLSNTFWHTNMILILKRATRYFPIIEPILKENDIPEDFKYLCVAESNLVPTAKSPAGAVGLWQIMDKTGKELGLEINDEVDERYHIEKSTKAACVFLKKAYKVLGSWALVAAAYNGGQSRVTKNISSQKQNNYYDILWSEETGRYVYRIIALKIIMNNPQQYGFNVTDNDGYSQYNYTEVKTDTTIADIAQFAIDNQSTYKYLKILNPWLRQNKLTNTKRKEYTILIPKN